MIGRNVSPMSMFTGGGDAFSRGMMIGSANSPATPMAAALSGVLQKYNSHLAAQQAEQSKMNLLTKEYDLKRSMSTAVDPDSVGPTVSLEPKTGQYFYSNSTVDPNTGMVKKSWSPVSPLTLDQILGKQFYEEEAKRLSETAINPNATPGASIVPFPGVRGPVVPAVDPYDQKMDRLLELLKQRQST